MRAWRGAGLLALVLVCLPAFAFAQQPRTNVTAGNSLPTHCVAPSTTRAEVYVLSNDTPAPAFYLCTATDTWTKVGSGGAGTPADPDASVQFNVSGSFGGDTAFTFAPLVSNLSPTSVVWSFSGVDGTDGAGPLLDQLRTEFVLNGRSSASADYGQFQAGASVVATVAPTDVDPANNIYVGQLVQSKTPSTTTQDVYETYGQIISNTYDGAGAAGAFVVGQELSVVTNTATSAIAGYSAVLSVQADVANSVLGMGSNISLNTAGSNIAAAVVRNAFFDTSLAGTLTESVAVDTVQQVSLSGQVGTNSTVNTWDAIYSDDLAGLATSVSFLRYGTRFRVAGDGNVTIDPLKCPSGQHSPVTVDDTGKLIAASCS